MGQWARNYELLRSLDLHQVVFVGLFKTLFEYSKEKLVSALAKGKNFLIVTLVRKMFELVLGTFISILIIFSCIGAAIYAFGSRDQIIGIFIILMTFAASISVERAINFIYVIIMLYTSELLVCKVVKSEYRHGIEHYGSDGDREYRYTSYILYCECEPERGKVYKHVSVLKRPGHSNENFDNRIVLVLRNLVTECPL